MFLARKFAFFVLKKLEGMDRWGRRIVFLPPHIFRGNDMGTRNGSQSYCLFVALLIVVLSTLLPGEKLRFHHVIGVLLGFFGAALVISKGNFGTLLQELTIGHALAFLCAVIWGLYSVLSRQLKEVPTDAVAGFCLVTGALALSAHFAIETTVLPHQTGQWLAIVLLGMFPVGLAFFTWDYGVKHGDIMALGAASYLSPMLSTIALVVSGLAQLSLSLALACFLIMCGAIVAAKDMIFKKTI